MVENLNKQLAEDFEKSYLEAKETGKQVFYYDRIAYRINYAKHLLKYLKSKI